jgi:hypothetical protein
VNVYEVPGTSPVTVHAVLSVVLHAGPAGDAVAV